MRIKKIKNDRLFLVLPLGLGFFYAYLAQFQGFIFELGYREIIQSPISTVFPGVYEQILIVIYSFD